MERKKRQINNEFYDDLKDDWYQSSDHPIALLRAENKMRTPWILKELDQRFSSPISILDIGCGAGLLTNALGEKGHLVYGIDQSEESLKTARRYDKTKRVHYEKADAYALPFPNQMFDAVSATDILEHVEKPSLLIQEASRVLKPGGVFFFHTFNRNPLSYLLIIKGVEWFVKNAPKDMHVYELFIRPKELKRRCEEHHLEVESMIGLRPEINLSFFQMLLTRKVPEGFSFRFSKSLITGYCGIARSKKDYIF